MSHSVVENPRASDLSDPVGEPVGDPETVGQRGGGQARGLEFERVFSRDGVHPFDEIEWEQREVSITDDVGGAVFSQGAVEVPKSWSQIAAKVAASKYFYGDIAHGTDPTRGGRESSIRQLVHRVTRTITDWGIEDGYFADETSAEVFYADLTWLCVNQHGVFNSPTWFNVGLHQQYGIGAGAGRGGYHYDATRGEAVRAATQYEYPQASACFIQSVPDSMEGIMRLATSEAMLFKFGSGTGSDLSTLRSTREKLSGGGKPSGPLSFLKVYDQIANVVKSGGKTRRAAKMNTLKDWHPDIEEFIEAKQREERKAWVLIEQGYSTGIDGDAYGSVMYQNENLSVRASDAFMEAAIAGTEWWTREVVTGAPCERKNAGTLLRKIAEGTHLCGDPGMQFDSTIHRWHTCKGSGRQNSTNPCSEYLFLDDTACNLASLNLLRFKRADGAFDVPRFQAAVRLFITAQDILVDRAGYPVKEIAENSHIFRTLGLGYSNLGALIMSYGYGYDSDEGRALAGALTAILTGQAYEQSALLASRMGPFPGYHDARPAGGREPLAPANVESMLEVIALHRAAVDSIQPAPRFAQLKEEAARSWDRALALGRRHGYRNAQVSVLAPTGTISLVMDCDTMGIEPDIALVKYKQLAGGGMFKMVNQSIPDALRALDYSEDEIASIVTHIDRFDTIEDVSVESPDGTPTTVHSGLRPEHLPVFDCSLQPKRGSRSLHYMGHLKMMAAAQPFLSGAISKTVNMPEQATVDEVMQTYIDAWRMGLKSVAIYRENSKRCSPLNTGKDAPGAPTTPLDPRIAQMEAEIAALRAKVESPYRRRMSTTRLSYTHKFEIAGHEGYLTVGLYPDGQPGELFIQMAKEGSTIGGLMDTIATLTSMALQYGVPLESLVNKFAYQRFDPSGFTKNRDIQPAYSITDYVFRWLGCQFIPGYRKSIAPHRDQPDLPMPEIRQMDRQAINRPVADLPVTADPTDPADSTFVPAPVSGAAGPPPAHQPPSNGGGAPPAPALSAMEHAFTGNTCGNCFSNKMVLVGACEVCLNCGETGGCG